MICEECKKEGLKSHVSELLQTKSMGIIDNFYDEEGRLHIHDPNITTSEYRCSNGHKCTTKTKNKCWCEKSEVCND